MSASEALNFFGGNERLIYALCSLIRERKGKVLMSRMYSIILHFNQKDSVLTDIRENYLEIFIDLETEPKCKIPINQFFAIFGMEAARGIKGNRHRLKNLKVKGNFFRLNITQKKISFKTIETPAEFYLNIPGKVTNTNLLCHILFNYQNFPSTNIKLKPLDNYHLIPLRAFRSTQFTL